MSHDAIKAPSALPSAAVTWGELARKSYLEINWNKVAHSAIGSVLFAGLVGGALHVLNKRMAAELHMQPVAPAFDEGEPSAESATTPSPVDADVAAAASLLGVTHDASEDEIRGALRSVLASSRLHPDQGGNEEQAKRLIAAKNLLMDRARQVRT